MSDQSDRNFAAWDRAYDRVRTAADADEARRAEYALAGLDCPEVYPDADRMGVVAGAYKPGTRVYWLESGPKRRTGLVVGCISYPMCPGLVYVVLTQTGPGLNDYALEEVDDISLQYGWDADQEAQLAAEAAGDRPATPAATPTPLPEGGDDIPF